MEKNYLEEIFIILFLVIACLIFLNRFDIDIIDNVKTDYEGRWIVEHFIFGLMTPFLVFIFLRGLTSWLEIKKYKGLDYIVIAISLLIPILITVFWKEIEIQEIIVELLGLISIGYILKLKLD